MLSNIIEKVSAYLGSQEFANLYSVITSTVIPLLVIIITAKNKIVNSTLNSNASISAENVQLRADIAGLKSDISEIKSLSLNAKNVAVKNLEATSIAYANSNLDNSVKLEIAKVAKSADEVVENVSNKATENVVQVKENVKQTISNVIDNASQNIEKAISEKKVVAKTAIEKLREQAGV